MTKAVCNPRIAQLKVFLWIFWRALIMKQMIYKVHYPLNRHGNIVANVHGLMITATWKETFPGGTLV